MVCLFEIKFLGSAGGKYYFSAKSKYLVSINAETGAGECDCLAGTFKISGAKQGDCKHVKKARGLLKAMGAGKKKVKK